MSLLHIVTAGALGGVLSIFSSWLFMGVMFHGYQRLTPETWRPEGPKQYAMSSAVQVIGGALIGLLYYMTGGPHLGNASWLAHGVVFGGVVWISVAVPIHVTSGIYVRLHRGVVIGSLVDSFVTLVLISCACAIAS